MRMNYAKLVQKVYHEYKNYCTMKLARMTDCFLTLLTNGITIWSADHLDSVHYSFNVHLLTQLPKHQSPKET